MSKLNLNSLLEQLELTKKVELIFSSLDEDVMMALNALAVKALSMRDSLFILNSIITIIRELVENAQKANAKRVFFRKHGKNIHEAREYAEVMREYEGKIREMLRNLKEDLDKSGLVVSVIFRFENGNLIVEVGNNIALLEDEKTRILTRMEMGEKSAHFLDIYGKIQDSTEGGGVGLVLILFMLRNMGIAPTALKLLQRDDYTWMQLRLPESFKPVEITTEIKRRILNDVKGIPTFPETIERLIGMCDDENLSIESIAEEIEKDPAITADLVRLSNSAGFISGKRIYNVADAVKTVGLKNVRALLLVCSARKIMDTRYKKFKEIWEHCNRVSAYSRYLAHEYHLLSKFENIAIAGLLHDLGMIVLISTDINLVKSIASLTRDKKLINSTILEEVYIGISHSVLGGIIARRWNFPDYLIEAIQHHHSPHDASKEFSDIVYAVYLANMLVGIEEKKYEYYFIENEVLKRFKLDGDGKIQKYHESIMETFRDESK